MLRSVTRELQGIRDKRDLTASFARQLAEHAQVRDVRLSELKGASALRTGTPIRTRDYVAFAVPIPDATRRIVLEASFDADHGLDGWTSQLLESAACLAALVLETSRSAGLPVPAVLRRDGAAPLIGSSGIMKALRERVERVATTDFTVLIEGPSRAQ